MKQFINTLLLLAVCPFASCSEKGAGEEEITEQFYITPAETRIDFQRLSASQSIAVTTNVPDIACKVIATGNWLTATYAENTLTVAVLSNGDANPRTGIVTLEGENQRQSVTVSQVGRSAALTGIKEDLKITVKSATASSRHTGEDIDKSYDGNMKTLYHSDYYGTTNRTTFPVTLTYRFENVETMDYLVYHPRTDSGTNGNFKEFDLYVATAENPALTLYGSYNFMGGGSPSVVSFSPALAGPATIEFRVKSGAGAGQGFVSCAEMQFFRRNPDNFDHTTLFTDLTCSRLKPGITPAIIEQVPNIFYRELALEIFRGEYDLEFRVQQYRAWQHPDVMAAANKTEPYSLRDNPTGIYVRQGEELIVLADDLHGRNVSLYVQKPHDGTAGTQLGGSAYPLNTGANKIKVANEGLIYVMYHTPTGTEDPVRINIATGHVNGYFDSRKHTKDDWKRLLDKASYVLFDLLGEYAHLTFHTDSFREYTPDGLALVNKYDELVRLEQEFMGLHKYDRAFRNRLYFLVMNNSNYIHATSYYTGYDVSTQKDILDLDKFTANPWGVAHEAGHIHQTRPGFKWKGMTEVTNNIHSLYVQTAFGNRSRLIKEDYYTKGFAIIDGTGAKTAHIDIPDVFCQLIPFWQLKLYMHDVAGKPDFYKDLYEKIRVNPDPATDGQCQMEFVKVACDVAQVDFTEFFDAWGFFVPVNKTVDDYGNAPFIVTQTMIDDCKAYIAGKGYVKPARAVQRLTDDNVK